MGFAFQRDDRQTANKNFLSRVFDKNPATTVYNLSADSFYRNEIFERAFAKISKEKMAYLDALILDLAERTPNVEHFVTWNAKHFKNKTALHVVTPEEFLQL